MLKVGRWYRLRFPGTFAKVIEFNPNSTPYSWLVESLVIKARWWVDAYGNPNNHCTPHMIVRR